MKFVFSPPLIVDRFNAHELTPVQSAQLLEAGNALVGRNTLEAVFREAERLETFWERYRVARADTGEAVYDAWALGSESGRVFVADTAEQTGIAMTQTGFEGDAEPDVIQALEAGHRRIGEAFDSAKSRAYWEEYRKKEAAASAQAGKARSVPPKAPSGATALVQATSTHPEAPAEAAAPADVTPVELPPAITEPVARSRATRVKPPSRGVKRPTKRKPAAAKKVKKPVAAKASRAASLEQARKKKPAKSAAAAWKPARKAAKKSAAILRTPAKPAKKAAAKPPNRRVGKKPLNRGSSKR